MKNWLHFCDIQAGIFRLERARAVKIPSRAELSWGTLIFELKPSWQYRQLADNMYVNKKQILVPTPKLQSTSLFFMNICKTIDILVVEYYNFQVYFIKIIIQKTKSKSWLVFGQFSVPSWMKKGHEPSRAENPSAWAMARASSARTHHY